jgi:prepilin-type N-terminal cleavage/methylation domain-containing protein
MHLTTTNKRAFTLIEIVVAIGLLAIVLMFTGSIFKSGIGSYRTATAQTEIMQKLRAITEQLNSDFKGLRKDAPLFIWFRQDPNDPSQRFDQIMFFADGDFQATQVPIVGNVARIYYGQARSIDPRDKTLEYPFYLLPVDRLLARRQHILTADTALPAWPDPDPANFITSFNNTFLNDAYEHDRISLSQWQALANDPLNGSANVDQIITTCFVNPPAVDITDPNTFHMLMTEGVGSFSIQWSYMFTNAGQTFIYWWPSNDPDGNGNFSDSDFGPDPLSMMLNSFGFYFYSVAPTGWFSSDGAKGIYYPSVKPVYPQSLKFTFTLYDSKGVFKEGQTFTHIVYLGD